MKYFALGLTLWAFLVTFAVTSLIQPPEQPRCNVEVMASGARCVYDKK